MRPRLRRGKPASVVGLLTLALEADAAAVASPGAKAERLATEAEEVAARIAHDLTNVYAGSLK